MKKLKITKKDKDLIRRIDQDLKPVKKYSDNVYKVKRGKEFFLLKGKEDAMYAGGVDILDEVELLKKPEVKGIRGITHLVDVYGSVDDKYFILKEHMEGKRPEKKLMQYKYGEKLYNQLKDTVQSFHSINICNLDLKPENMIISPKKDDIKIIDLDHHHTAKDLEGWGGFDMWRKSDLYIVEIFSFENVHYSFQYSPEMLYPKPLDSTPFNHMKKCGYSAFECIKLFPIQELNLSKEKTLELLTGGGYTKSEVLTAMIRDSCNIKK